MPTALVNGVQLYYEVNGSGLPLVLAHGGGGNLNQWAFQVPALALKYQVITYDNRGHGRSESPETGYSMEIFSEDILGLIDLLGLEKVVLVGLTMGAMTALRFALDHPNRLEAMILIGVSEGGREQMKERFEMSAQIAEEHGMEMLAEGFCSVVFSPWFQEEKSDYVEAVKKEMKEASPRGYAETIRALANRSTLKDKLSKINTKTLLVVGEDDITEFPLEDADLFVRELPDAELVKIPKAGHLACIEQPEVFNSLLERFIRKIGYVGMRY